MKGTKNMKKLLSIIALLLGVVTSSFSQTVYSTNVGASNVILLGRYSISSVTVVSTNVATVFFYDTTNALLWYTNATTRYLTNTNAINFEVVFTNSLGNVATSYYNGAYYFWTTNNAKSNASPAFSSISVEANTPITLPVDWFIAAGLGIKVSSGTASITLLYK